MCNPGSGAGPHDRLERRHHAARRNLHVYSSFSIALVAVRLAVGSYDDLRRAQIVLHDMPQRLRRPVLRVVELEPLVLLRFAQGRAHLRQDGHGELRRFGVVEKLLAANVADQERSPATNQYPHCAGGDERHRDHRQDDKHHHEVACDSLVHPRAEPVSDQGFDQRHAEECDAGRQQSDRQDKAQDNCS